METTKQKDHQPLSWTRWPGEIPPEARIPPLTPAVMDKFSALLWLKCSLSSSSFMTQKHRAPLLKEDTQTRAGDPHLAEDYLTGAHITWAVWRWHQNHSTTEEHFWESLKSFMCHSDMKDLQQIQRHHHATVWVCVSLACCRSTVIMAQVVKTVVSSLMMETIRIWEVNIRKDERWAIKVDHHTSYSHMNTLQLRYHWVVQNGSVHYGKERYGLRRWGFP